MPLLRWIWCIGVVVPQGSSGPHRTCSFRSRRCSTWTWGSSGSCSPGIIWCGRLGRLWCSLLRIYTPTGTNGGRYRSCVWLMRWKWKRCLPSPEELGSLRLSQHFLGHLACHMQHWIWTKLWCAPVCRCRHPLASHSPGRTRNLMSPLLCLWRRSLGPSMLF